jgi:hypothetical protein
MDAEEGGETDAAYAHMVAFGLLTWVRDLPA